MNIVRTKAVELSSIPAIAYKQKLASGGAGIKIFRLDSDASAVVTVDKRRGDIVPYGTIDETLFPYEALDEALELLVGLPYSARGKLVVREFVQAEQEVEEIEEVENIDMLESDEYKAIIERYTDENGKLNFTLMNKDFIQFASKSKVVAQMVEDKVLTDDILLFIVISRAAYFANKKESLNEKSANALMETLEEISPRSAFKEIKSHINKMLARRK